MATFVTFCFICAGLSGIHMLKTVSHIMMEAGGTVHIPCQYETWATDHVKYLCRGATWSSCTKKICSDHKNSTKYSIYDDKVHRIVTFTVTSLEQQDSDFYWCNIDKVGTDDGSKFQLSIKAESMLSVDSQWVLGYFDDQITIQCKYKGSGEKMWCRVGDSCISTSGILKTTEVSIDTHAAGVFAVTMTGLKADDIGWYWCDFENLQMPVFLDLTIRPTTIPSTPEPGSMSITSNVIISSAIALSLLILIIIVSLVTWCMLKRKMKKTEGESSSSPECVDNPLYSSVTRKSASLQNTDAAKDNELLYSSVTFIKHQSSKKSAVTQEDVLYSTLAHQ